VSDADTVGDTSANAAPDVNASTHCATDVDPHTVDDGCDDHRRTDADGRHHAVADTITRTTVTEPRTRGARTVRVGRDDRFCCMDLAPVSQLAPPRKQLGPHLLTNVNSSLRLHERNYRPVFRRQGETACGGSDTTGKSLRCVAAKIPISSSLSEEARAIPRSACV
jgi:hypothetical protein